LAEFQAGSGDDGLIICKAASNCRQKERAAAGAPSRLKIVFFLAYHVEIWWLLWSLLSTSYWGRDRSCSVSPQRVG
jgi:hypothetical protein